MQRKPPFGTPQLFAAALAAHQAGRLPEAERLYRQILATDARHADALHFLGILLHESGKSEAGIALIQKAIAQNPRAAAFHNNLGMILFAQGKLEAASECYRRALKTKPQFPEADYNLGVALQASGEPDAAAASYERVLATNPDAPDALTNLGIVRLEQGNLDAAIGCFERALVASPDHAQAHNNLANARRQQGNWALAAASYQRALSHAPDYAEAHLNLGMLLIEQGRSGEALAHLERALKHQPALARAYVGLATALKEQGQPDAALAAYAQALALNPDYAEARLGRAIAVIPIFADDVPASTGAAEKFLRSLEDLAPWAQAHATALGSCVGTQQPFYLAYRPGDVGTALARYGDLIAPAAAAYWQPKARAARAARDRTRLLVVSGHVQQHPVWEVILRGMIEHLDRSRLEICLFHTGAECDGETEWARARVERFVQGPKAVKAWLEDIEREQPDAIFYPEVGMDPATSVLAALRLAPLQIAGWGHPVTTGLPSIDRYCSGELLEAGDAEPHYREQLVRLPGLGVCTQMRVNAAHAWRGPESSARIVRFALCQQPIKFDPADDALLTGIAKAVGACQFWLVRPKKLDWAAVRLRARLSAAFKTAGLDPQAYLRETPWMPPAEFAGFLDAMDIYLDCPGFSGYTTAWAAIHRGLPVIALEGRYLRQRLAAALLRKIGREDQIARSHEGYTEIAEAVVREILSGSGAAQVRRDAIRSAANLTDGNVSAVRAFEQLLIEGARA